VEYLDDDINAARETIRRNTKISAKDHPGNYVTISHGSTKDALLPLFFNFALDYVISLWLMLIESTGRKHRYYNEKERNFDLEVNAEQTKYMYHNTIYYTIKSKQTHKQENATKNEGKQHETKTQMENTQSVTM
jgi:hypothetical protein